MAFRFSTTPHSLVDIPNDPVQFVKDAESFINGVNSWKKIKDYSYKLDDGSKESVTTYGTHVEKEYWLARVSEHSVDEVEYEKMIKYLIGAEKKEGLFVVDDNYKHTEYELEYIHVLNKWEKVPLESFDEYAPLENKEKLKKWVSIRAEYELGAPLTTREFNEFMMIVEPGYINECAYVIQLVSNRTTTSGHVQGVYCSIERIKRVNDTKIEWSMCTASDSGGNVPKWLQNSMISKSVAADVPGFLNWVKKQA